MNSSRRLICKVYNPAPIQLALMRFVSTERQSSMKVGFPLHPSSSRPLRLLRVGLLAMRDWKRRRYAAPSPAFVKECVLLRNGIDGATWVETGTYLGDTTALLSRHARQVYSIEPAPGLFEQAARRFRASSTVRLLPGTSEQRLPELLATLSGDINFWLDGHYSAGVTYQGPVDTPIVNELECIANHLGRFRNIVVLVDDVRCFDPS